MLREEFTFFEKAPDLIDPLLPFVYLDSAATMQRPDQVIQEEAKYYETLNANPLRGLYKLSVQSTDLLKRTRQQVAEYIGADPDEIIFTKNTTEGINLVANGISDLISDKSRILISLDSHHSNILPFTERYGERAEICSNVLEAYRKNPDYVKLIVLTGISNVSGEDQTGEVKKLCRAGYTGLILIDAAQLLPHKEVNVKKLAVEMLAFSGHKIGAPMGIGVLYIQRELMPKIKPLNYGGEMVDAVEIESKNVKAELAFGPQKYEGGTINMGGVAGLGSTIEFWRKHNGNCELFKEVERLTEYTVNKMNELAEVKVFYGSNGIILFNVDGVHPHDTAQILSNYGVMVRAGWHCAEPFLTQKGIGPAVRASLMFYNSKVEIDYFVSILAKIREEMRNV